jgi:hypothetical protein
MSGPVYAATPQDVVYYSIYRSISTQYQGQYSGDWVRCVYATAQATPYYSLCTHNVTVTTTVNGSAGYSDGTISAVVGFNIDYTQQFGNGVAFYIAPYTSGWNDMGFRYNQYLVGMESETCIRETGQCFGWSGPTWVTVQNELGETYEFFPTS